MDAIHCIKEMVETPVIFETPQHLHFPSKQKKQQSTSPHKRSSPLSHLVEFVKYGVEYVCFEIPLQFSIANTRGREGGIVIT
jgi:hypothetical protein